MELGAAYDRAMAAEVFGPLGMTSTTFDFARALNGNHASSHALDIDGKPALAAMGVNYSILPVRPAGGAWSSVTDVMKYVQMELAKGLLPGGTRYVVRGGAEGAAGAEGVDRQGRLVRHGAAGGPDLRHPASCTTAAA